MAATGSTQPHIDPSAPRRNPGERRIAAGAAILLAAVLYLLLPNPLVYGPRLLVPTLEVALFIPLLIANPHRFTRETAALRAISIALIVLITAANLTALGFLLHALVGSHPESGRSLLLGAGQVWITNMIAFALVFWELDRGGAVARLPSSNVPTRHADFLFPQDDENVARVEMGSSKEVWIPVFVDYLYLSITNSTAFSPTDTMPLTARAKMLMTFEAIAAMVTSLLVVARAVNILT